MRAAHKLGLTDPQNTKTAEAEKYDTFTKQASVAFVVYSIAASGDTPVAPRARARAMSLSTARDSGPAEPPYVSMQASAALSLGLGISRVRVQDLGPFLFNRRGAPTSGRHCYNIMKRISMYRT